MLKPMSIAAMAVTLLLAFCAGAKATTVGTLLTDFRSDIGEEDSTNSRFTNVQARRLLTRSQAIVGTYIGGVEAQSKIALQDTVTDYSLGSYWGISAVMYKVDADYIHIERVNPDELGTRKFSSFLPQESKPEGPTEQSSALERYAIFKDTLMLYPSLSFASDTLYVKGFVAPASLDSNSQELQFDIWVDDFIVETAVFLANKRDLSLGDELSFWQSFTNRLLAAQSLYVKSRTEVKVPAQGGIQ